jgi:hypothetical protein
MATAFPELLHYLSAMYFWDEDTTDDIEVVCARGAAAATVARLRSEVLVPGNLAFVDNVEMALLEVREDGERALYCTLTTIGERLVIVGRDAAGSWKPIGKHWDEAPARAMLSERHAAVPA